MEHIDGTKDRESSGRLLTLTQAAAYLSVSYWTVRGLIDNSALASVRLPAARSDGRSMRRILVDRKDLDQLIDDSKHKHDCT